LLSLTIRSDPSVLLRSPTVFRLFVLLSQGRRQPESRDACHGDSREKDGFVLARIGLDGLRVPIWQAGFLESRPEPFRPSYE
jgi:hypothetical protein